jgi:16S rRNA (cytosine967-C5)-methyltransferase
MATPICFASGSPLSHRPNARGYAAELLHRVAFEGHSLDRILSEAAPLERDRSLVHELTIGSVRHFYSLSDEVNSRLLTPLKPRDSIVFCLLLVGAYQLRHTRIPAYASVSETVNATRQIGRPWSRGLVNQIMRRIASEGATYATTDEAEFDHPAWLIEQIRDGYPVQWREILAISLTRAPLTLRVNTSKTHASSYITALLSAGVSAHLGRPDDCLVLHSPTPASSLPGFDQGLVSVQDSGAMWAAHLLSPTKDEHVLDACAAPGGKAMHLLERAPGLDLVALDLDPQRCDQIRSECGRLGFDPAIVIQGDATNLLWWDGEQFDAILLDAPCSGTGTLRRHPDIKLLKRASDLAQYQDLQVQLLKNLWGVLKAGGRLLYCTCSILSAENDDVVERFVALQDDAQIEPISDDWGVAKRFGRQLLPELNGADGFYYSMIKKRPCQ